MTLANAGDQSQEPRPVPDIDGFKYLMGGSGKQPKRKTGWASMNRIQKAGGILFLCLVPGSFGHHSLVIFFALTSWTCLFLGYVAGALWKVRHAIHFWCSLAAATLAHLAVLPAYAYLFRLLNNGPHSSGREIFYPLGALLSIEVITFVVILKKIGLWLFRLEHTPPH